MLLQGDIKCCQQTPLQKARNLKEKKKAFNFIKDHFAMEESGILNTSMQELKERREKDTKRHDELPFAGLAEVYKCSNSQNPNDLEGLQGLDQWQCYTTPDNQTEMASNCCSVACYDGPDVQ